MMKEFDRKVMTVPIIDSIDMNTWAYHPQYGYHGEVFRGIFEWGLLYKESEVPEKERRSLKRQSQPFKSVTVLPLPSFHPLSPLFFRSPTHAGGLFAIDRKWFEQLGFYDSGLKIWGGEQYELSFKVVSDRDSSPFNSSSSSTLALNP